MPSLGADMEAGTLVEWRVAPGDRVARGDIVAVVETQKGAIEVEIFDDGEIESLLVEPGEKVPVGTPLARLSGGAAGETAVRPVPEPRAEAKPPTLPPRPTPAAPAAGAGRLRSSPAARRRAAALGVELAAVVGSGPQGAITVADVEAAAGAAAKPAPAGERRTGMREAIAAAMSRAKREIPHYYLAATIDLAPALAWLEAENDHRPPTERLLYSVLLLKAVARALRDFPELNGFYADGERRASEAIHVGVAIALRGGGLIAPALADADGKDVATLMREFRDLVARARVGGLRSSELGAATITVTSLGERGVETIFPVIYPPQVAIVGFGSVVERPWSLENEIVSRRLITASLAADHRVSDGHRGALFLERLADLLKEPEKL